MHKKHTKPGLIDVHLKQNLLKEKTLEAAEKIRELELKSDRLFGSFKCGGMFIFDKEKVPDY